MNFFEIENPNFSYKKPRYKHQKSYDINELTSTFFDGLNLNWDFEEKKKEFIDHMDFLKSLNVREEVLYKKWKQLKAMNSTTEIVNFGLVQDQIWMPTDIFDYEKTISEINSLEPVIQIVGEDGIEYEQWSSLRHMIHSFSYTQPLGRLIYVIIRSASDNKVIGIASLASDIPRIRVRDEYIGWNLDDRFQKGNLKNIAICSTIVPTQPFGYNFLGGKLIASLMCSEKIRKAWEDKFGNKLVGLTTTSLYGAHSMYQRIPWWVELGESSGLISIKPDNEYYFEWVNWLKTNQKNDYDDAMFPKIGEIVLVGKEYQWISLDKSIVYINSDRQNVVNFVKDKGYTVYDTNIIYDPHKQVKRAPSGPKQSILSKIYKHLEISPKQYNHGFSRGIFFAPLYENTNLFLQNKISEDELILSQKLKGDQDTILKWWKEKSIKRYTNLYNKNRIKPEILYYRDMIQMNSWEEVKNIYLNEIGR